MPGDPVRGRRRGSERFEVDEVGPAPLRHRPPRHEPAGEGVAGTDRVDDVDRRHWYGQSLVVRSDHRDVRSPRGEQHDARPAGQQAARGVDRRLARRHVGEVVVADLHHIGSREHGVDAARGTCRDRGSRRDGSSRSTTTITSSPVVSTSPVTVSAIGSRIESEPACEQRRGRGRKPSRAAAPGPMSPPCRSGRWLRPEHRARPRRASSGRSPAADSSVDTWSSASWAAIRVPKRSSDTAPMNPTVAPSRPQVRAVLNGAPPSAALDRAVEPDHEVDQRLPGDDDHGCHRARSSPVRHRSRRKSGRLAARDQHRLTLEVVSDRHDRAGPARRITSWPIDTDSRTAGCSCPASRRSPGCRSTRSAATAAAASTRPRSCPATRAHRSVRSATRSSACAHGRRPADRLPARRQRGVGGHRGDG